MCLMRPRIPRTCRLPGSPFIPRCIIRALSRSVAATLGIKGGQPCARGLPLRSRPENRLKSWRSTSTGPKPGEVMVEIRATGICHTDEFTLSGADPEGLFPAILGHEGAGVVVEVGQGVTSVKKGDHVIPLYTPECRTCPSCLSREDQPLHLDPRDARQGRDARRHERFTMLDGDPILHYMGCSTFANHTVLPEIAVAKVREDAPFDKICYIGCGVTTGIGAVINTAKVEIGAKAAVFGLGGIGLNVIQGLRLAGRRHDHRRRHQPREEGDGRAVRDDPFRQPEGMRERRAGDREPDEDALRPDRRGGLLLRLHRQREGDARRARMHPPGLGRLRRHRRRTRRGRDRRRGRSSWSPAGSGKARPSAARGAGRTCRRSSTGTWTGRSRSTR